jgi:hypothetical protein
MRSDLERGSIFQPLHPSGHCYFCGGGLRYTLLIAAGAGYRGWILVNLRVLLRLVAWLSVSSYRRHCCDDAATTADNRFTGALLWQ